MASKSELLVFEFLRSISQLNILPKEIVLLFVLWLGCDDKIDEEHCDEPMYVEIMDDDSQLISRLSGGNDIYYSVVGQSIIQKGQIQEWRFKILSRHLVIGE